jgi:hypothetical protein
MKALVIPVEGPVKEIELSDNGSQLDELQAAVGGSIEAIRLPEFIDPDGTSTAYIHEEGKFVCEPNMRATDFMVPGVGLFFGDYIAGPLVLCGFNPTTGENADVTDRVARRVRKIAREAGA